MLLSKTVYSEHSPQRNVSAEPVSSLKMKRINVGGLSCYEPTEAAFNLSEEDPYVKYRIDGRDVYVRKLTATKLIIFAGPTGVGKSVLAREIAGEEGYYKSSGVWWQDYKQQQIVVVDMFDGKDVTYNELLKLADHMPYRVEVKFGSAIFNSAFTIITSNECPADWYEDRESFAELESRTVYTTSNFEIDRVRFELLELDTRDRIL